MLVDSIYFFAIKRKLLMQLPDRIVDVLQLRITLHLDVLTYMDLDAGRAQRKQAFLRTAKISEQFVLVKGAL